MTSTISTRLSTTVEVTEALQNAHDHYLTVIATFEYFYSRTSHVSSIRHMHHLVRKMVCELLTTAETVLRHLGISSQHAQELHAAKGRLNNSLEDAVWQSAISRPGNLEEEEASATTLRRSARHMLKASSDCVHAVRKCPMQQRDGQWSLVIGTRLREMDLASFAPSESSHMRKRSNRLCVSPSPNALLTSSGLSDVGVRFLFQPL